MHSRPSETLSRMDQYYVLLAEALRDRLAVIADHQLRDQNPTAHLTRLQQASERIEQLQKPIAGRCRSDAGSLSQPDEPE